MKSPIKILTQTGTIAGLFHQDISLDEPFIDFAMRFAHIPGTICLMSGTNLDCARYHMLATRPILTLSGKGKSMKISTEASIQQVEADPFDTLRQLLIHFENPEIDFPKPVSAGLFGYLAYDLKNHIETLPQTTMDRLDLPEIYMAVPSLIVIMDKQEKKNRLFIPELTTTKESGVTQALEFFNCMRKKPLPPDKPYTAGKGLHSNFDKASYMACINKIKEYITAGDIYQVNMSQRFEADFAGSPAALFKKLFQQNPAPFFAYINAGDHWVVSTSPERFIKQSGKFVETRPIKGTFPRGASPDEDQANRSQLIQSRKDDAELSMIVDLMRNDLGKVSVGGSVSVVEHKRLEAYTNVYHLVSIIHSTLAPTADCVDLLKATFPGGSITGCPKIRCMEIIDELETHHRHVYTGSIGYISFHDTLDLSIAIRTAVIRNNYITFSVGGGVVFDSDPSAEYLETLDKGKTLREAITGHPAPLPPDPVVWINGRLIPAPDAVIPLSDLGVHYGHGFFETLRVEKNSICFLTEHLQRLEKAWTQFFPQPFPDLSWKRIIHRVITACDLNHSTAAVKIIVTRGSRTQPPWDHQIIITANPYTHRLTVLNKKGLDLVTFGKGRQTPLADCKSLNYQYYYLAGKNARELGADESLILNPDGSISEGNTTNLLFIKNRELFIPSSPHRLSGIMEAKIKTILISQGYTLVEGPVFPCQVKDFHAGIATNSLMGAVPIFSIDGTPLDTDPSCCQLLNQALSSLQY